MLGWLSTMHSWVLPKLLPHQRLVLIPPFYGDGKNTTAADALLDCDDGDCDRPMARWANFTRVLINATADQFKIARRVVAVTPYIYNSINDGIGRRSLGGKHLPQALAIWKEIGASIVQATSLKTDDLALAPGPESGATFDAGRPTGTTRCSQDSMPLGPWAVQIWPDFP